LNSISILGRLVADPEKKTIQTKNGPKDLVEMRIACEDPMRLDPDGSKHTDWFNASSFQSVEFIMNYAQKGNLVAISGRMKSTTKPDENGKNRTWWNIDVQSFEKYVTEKRDANAPSTTGNTSTGASATATRKPVASTAAPVDTVDDSGMDFNAGF